MLIICFINIISFEQDAEVRETTISVLSKIYSKGEFHTHLVKFTKKFLPRYVELIKDVNVPVAVEALKMLTLLLKELEICSYF